VEAGILEIVQMEGRQSRRVYVTFNTSWDWSRPRFSRIRLVNYGDSEAQPCAVDLLWIYNRDCGCTWPTRMWPT
jgi:hypothetical protein